MQFTYKCTGFQFSKITCQKQTFSFISLKTCIMLDKQDLKNGSFFILQKKKTFSLIMIVPVASKHWNSVQNMPTMNHLVYDDTHLSRPPAPALSLMP